MKDKLFKHSVRIKNKINSVDVLKYVIAGFTAFIVDSIILNLLSLFVFDDGGGEIFGIISVAKFISGCFGISVSFYLNRTWSFKATDGELKNQMGRMALSFLFTILSGSIVYSLYLDILNTQEIMDFGDFAITLSNALTTGTLMVINFFIYKFIVFKL